MPTPKKSDKRIEAQRLYEESGGTMPYEDIAAATGLSVAMLRKCKCKDHWRADLTGNAPPKESTNVTSSVTSKPKRGAPRGKRNGSYKHGAYQTFDLDHLTPEQRAVRESVNTDTLAQAEETIKNCHLREWHLRRVINENPDAATQLKAIAEQSRNAGKLLQALETKARLTTPQQPATVVNVNGGGLDLKSLNLRSLSDEDLDRLGELVDKMGASSHADA